MIKIKSLSTDNVHLNIMDSLEYDEGVRLVIVHHGKWLPIVVSRAEIIKALNKKAVKK